ncbi:MULTISPECIES: T6SS immunity protein Tli4 family protein [unclassified Janthinobacterium]|uniref:T6SS immunity protein Tli4 family protein n=1 Tax=unclassified Janthinobacterium TaxID=2610881 RepID=UPI001804A3B5|nr:MULTISPECIES: T6SS immunity protein Tli4 family protein [unclassified Janthinobacterium]MBB5609898.1 hypothetical protein [Janthinobacterium sp. S3T4]MBB5615164.1 hypothetical protein [Janthinobacterium sp. S3M3]
MRYHKPRTPYFFSTLLILTLLSACAPKTNARENAVPESVQLSKRLEVLFLKTKLLCFGRYAIEVPEEAQLIFGSISFSSSIETIKGGLPAMQERIAEDVARIKLDRTSDIRYNDIGPISGSWQIRYFDDETSKKYNLFFFNTYINKGDLTFILGDSAKKNETEYSTVERQSFNANNLQLRDNNEIPITPGYCLDHGFISNHHYDSQEMASAGLYFPSLPDVTFSISSNKDAYGDYPPAQFEKEMREELSLLKRIQGAKDIQGSSYPKRTLLREGKRDVQHWHGEESLIRRNDGVHDFEWALVGKPMDVAYPSEFSVHMYTKVEHNMVGATEAASLSDDEAVALWDKLLSGLKFRVKVPGAPPGSYYIDPDKPKPVPAS